MNFFTIKETTHFKNKVFGEGALIEGETYFAYSQFAEEAVNQGLGEIISIKNPPFIILEPASIRERDIRSKKILLYFAGGFGDSVMIGMVLPFIENKSGIQFDICCSREKWFDIFRPMGVKGGWVSYPPSIDVLALYEGVITDITRFFSNEGIRVSPIGQICNGFDLDPTALPKTTYHLDEEIKNRLKLPDSSIPRVAINLDSNGSVKSYPPALQIELLKRLKAIGLEIFLLGHKHPDHPSFSEELAFDLRDKTTISELAVLIKQMDLVITMDSFICHMANVLEIPALVLLSTTSPDFFSFHPNVSCMTSRLECSPCYHVFDNCPQGRNECLAFHHESIAPSIITSMALEQLIKSFKNKIAVNSCELQMESSTS
jgi:hypothetical protein